MTTIGFASTEGGCSYYRAQVPAMLLRERGYETVTGESLIIGTEGGFGFEQPDGSVLAPDVIVLAGGWPQCGDAKIRMTRRNGQRVIVDCDDWPHLPISNPHYSLRHGAIAMSAMRAADAVTVSTGYLREQLAPHGITTSVVRNVLEVGMFERARAHNAKRAAMFRDGGPISAGVFRVGYRGLLAGFHDDDVRELRGVEADEWVHYGADPRADVTFAELLDFHKATCENQIVREVPVRRFGGYPDQLASVAVDCAVIPYADRPFSFAKSFIAALEWTAAGVPWIVSQHPAYRALDPAGAWSVKGARSWRAAVRWMRDPAVRAVTLEAQRAACAPWLLPGGGSETADGWEKILAPLL